MSIGGLTAEIADWFGVLFYRARGLTRLERRLDERIVARLEHLVQGSQATYVSNNRVLVKVAVQGHVIAYLVPADDRLLSPWMIVSGTYEPRLSNYFAHNLKPDSRCFDIGSNFGYFTCLMARLCPAGQVTGIEPDRTIFELARDNVLINNLHDRARVIHGAASNAAGEIPLYRRSTRSGNTSIT